MVNPTTTLPTTQQTKTLRSVSTQYQQLFPTETSGLFWEDDFFDQEQDIIAVFDYDHELAVDYATSVSKIVYFSFFCQLSLMGFFIGSTAFSWGFNALNGLIGVLISSLVFILLTQPCFLRKRARWSVECEHLAVTRDGIRSVNDRRKACWGLPMCDQGKYTKTVAYDKITDCDLIEPAGATCCCIQNTLYTVFVDTASSGREGRELSLSGLKKPKEFKTLI